MLRPPGSREGGLYIRANVGRIMRGVSKACSDGHSRRGWTSSGGEFGAF